jgi:hypothetical protein
MPTFAWLTTLTISAVASVTGFAFWRDSKKPNNEKWLHGDGPLFSRLTSLKGSLLALFSKFEKKKRWWAPKPLNNYLERRRFRQACRAGLVTAWEKHLEKRLTNGKNPADRATVWADIMSSKDYARQVEWFSPTFVDSIYPFRLRLSIEKTRELRDRLYINMGYWDPDSPPVFAGSLFSDEDNDEISGGLHDANLLRVAFTSVDLVGKPPPREPTPPPPGKPVSLASMFQTKKARKKAIVTTIKAPSKTPAYLEEPVTQTPSDAGFTNLESAPENFWSAPSFGEPDTEEETATEGISLSAGPLAETIKDEDFATNMDIIAEKPRLQKASPPSLNLGTRGRDLQAYKKTTRPLITGEKELRGDAANAPIEGKLVASFVPAKEKPKPEQRPAHVIVYNMIMDTLTDFDVRHIEDIVTEHGPDTARLEFVVNALKPVISPTGPFWKLTIDDRALLAKAFMNNLAIRDFLVFLVNKEVHNVQEEQLADELRTLFGRQIVMRHHFIISSFGIDLTIGKALEQFRGLGADEILDKTYLSVIENKSETPYAYPFRNEKKVLELNGAQYGTTIRGTILKDMLWFLWMVKVSIIQRRLVNVPLRMNCPVVFHPQTAKEFGLTEPLVFVGWFNLEDRTLITGETTRKGSKVNNGDLRMSEVPDLKNQMRDPLVSTIVNFPLLLPTSIRKSHGV